MNGPFLAAALPSSLVKLVTFICLLESTTQKNRGTVIPQKEVVNESLDYTPRFSYPLALPRFYKEVPRKNREREREQAFRSTSDWDKPLPSNVFRKYTEEDLLKLNKKKKRLQSH